MRSHSLPGLIAAVAGSLVLTVAWTPAFILEQRTGAASSGTTGNRAGTTGATAGNAAVAGRA